ncbi:MAG: 50S ribosomal protein L21 [Patescibacteria group bacterium]|jgi:large subunit ribosomal protein L21|nr:50S ribosomal protein L21 [Patescibacteria group bacterium]
MLAVIETGGKQYLIKEGDKIKIEKLTGNTGDKIVFDKVLLLAAENGKLEIGKPYLEKHSVEAEILKIGRSRKVIVFRYHSKTRYRKKRGHRQWYTEAKITKIK